MSVYSVQNTGAVHMKPSESRIDAVLRAGELMRSTSTQPPPQPQRRPKPLRAATIGSMLFLDMEEELDHVEAADTGAIKSEYFKKRMEARKQTKAEEIGSQNAKEGVVAKAKQAAAYVLNMADRGAAAYSGFNAFDWYPIGNGDAVIVTANKAWDSTKNNFDVKKSVLQTPFVQNRLEKYGVKLSKEGEKHGLQRPPEHYYRRTQEQSSKLVHEAHEKGNEKAKGMMKSASNKISPMLLGFTMKLPEGLPDGVSEELDALIKGMQYTWDDFKKGILPEPDMTYIVGVREQYGNSQSSDMKSVVALLVLPLPLSEDEGLVTEFEMLQMETQKPVIYKLEEVKIRDMFACRVVPIHSHPETGIVYGEHEIYVPRAGPANVVAGEKRMKNNRAYDIHNYRVVYEGVLRNPLPIAEGFEEGGNPTHIDLRLLWSTAILGKSLQGMAANATTSKSTKEKLNKVLGKAVEFEMRFSASGAADNCVDNFPFADSDNEDM